jgi:predicted ATPase
MKLGSLNREEITSMIMKTLGLQRKEVKSDVLEGVAIQSGGMPHFVNEILEHVKRQMALDPDFEITDVSEQSVCSIWS